jgi:hypothetical protein
VRSIAISSDDKRVKIWKLTPEGIPHGKAVYPEPPTRNSEP